MDTGDPARSVPAVLELPRVSPGLAGRFIDELVGDSLAEIPAPEPIRKEEKD